jgi:hypothetical protein
VKKILTVKMMGVGFTCDDCEDANPSKELEKIRRTHKVQTVLVSSKHAVTEKMPGLTVSR